MADDTDAFSVRSTPYVPRVCGVGAQMAVVISLHSKVCVEVLWLYATKIRKDLLLQPPEGKENCRPTRGRGRNVISVRRRLW